MRFQSLIQTLAYSENILILCHQNADPDALGSAYAVSQLILRKAPSKKVEIGAPEGVSRVARQVLQSLPLSITTSPNVNKADVILLVDTNTLVQLGELGELIKVSSKPLALIDHHAPHIETVERSILHIIDEEASSTCEIIYGLFEEADIELDRNVALALFLGIAYDTRHFIIAKSHTFRTVSKLLDSGLVAEEAMPLLISPLNVSERVARLKAAQRLQSLKLGEWIVTESRVGSYQSSAARGILALGADVAIVGGIRKGKLRISLRSTKKFFMESRVHLGHDIAAPLGKHIDGMGGGHGTAAGINGKGSLDEALKTCMNLLKNEVSRLRDAKLTKIDQNIR